MNLMIHIHKSNYDTSAASINIIIDLLIDLFHPNSRRMCQGHIVSLTFDL